MVKQADKEMLLEKLEGVLDIYGADMSRWPSADLQALRGFVREDADARIRLEEAVALHDVLNLSFVQEPSPDLKARILAAAAEDRAPTAGAADSNDIRDPEQYAVPAPNAARNMWAVCRIDGRFARIWRLPWS